MNIWAHRGCSQNYPENTLTAFNEAMNIKGLIGIELDIQLTRDGEIVVVHDERVDRTTDGTGFVRDFTLEELKCLHIHDGTAAGERIPTISEVLSLLSTAMRDGLLLNIELKNSVYPYPGMEKKMIELLRKDFPELTDKIVWSSFYASSLSYIRRELPQAHIGILDVKASDCLFKLAGGCGADAIHPHWRDIDVSPEKLENMTVRAWFTGHLYPEKPTGGRLDLASLEQKGITDVFLNEPEVYLPG